MFHLVSDVGDERQPAGLHGDDFSYWNYVNSIISRSFWFKWKSANSTSSFGSLELKKYGWFFHEKTLLHYWLWYDTRIFFLNVLWARDFSLFSFLHEELNAKKWRSRAEIFEQSLVSSSFFPWGRCHRSALWPVGSSPYGGDSFYTLLASRFTGRPHRELIPRGYRIEGRPLMYI